MNDFTKDELEEISRCTEHMSLDFNLVDKIEALIDNYCEHEWENYCCGCDPENLVCKKCEKDLWGIKL